MPRTILLGLFALAAAGGCGSRSEETVIPTVIKQPPGSDSPGGPKGIAPKKAPDAGSQKSADG